MSDEEKDIEVSLPEPEKTETPVEIVEEAPKSSKSSEISPDEAIQDLKKRLELERLARSEAERRAVEAQHHAVRASEQTVETQYQLVSNAIDTLKSRSESIKVALRDAHTAGDFDRVAELQEAMATNTSQLEKLKDGKKAMKKQMKAAEQQQAYAQQVPQGDPMDNIIATVARTSPKSAAWLQDNRESIKTEREFRKMMRAHEDAIDDGIQADSPEYFEFIESRLGLVKERNREEAPAPRRSVSPPPAPVSRVSSRPNVVRLSAMEASTAKELGMSPEEYAKNKALLQKEGRYGH